MTADQVRAVVSRLTAAGHWHDGDPNILIVMDAGYDVTRLAFVLADLPFEVLGRIRSDRVLRLPKPRHWPAACAAPGRNPPRRDDSPPPGFAGGSGASPLPAGAPKPIKPGPGRPPGSTNRSPAPRYDVGKTIKRDLTVTGHQHRTG
ncbi:hypothetical protein Franean1_3150 [Parafrankia sp. EAN1pec]|nr:hypothetical protein Franean1_3150 [Frankia sp. EAN1pec]